MNTTELIEIARECGGRYAYTNWGYHPFSRTELQQFAQRIEAPHLQRIAELEKQVEQLRKGLEKIADLDGNWGPFPETNKHWCAMAVVTARETLKEMEQTK